MSEVSKNKNVGRVRVVRGQVVLVECDGGYRPSLHELLASSENENVRLEVYAYRSDRELYCLLLSRRDELFRNMSVYSTGSHIEVPVGECVLGRVVGLYGDPQDEGGPIESSEVRSIYGDGRDATIGHAGPAASELFETGIKALDFFTPLIRGGKIGLIGGAGVGKTMLMSELLHNMGKVDDNSVSIFAGIGERIREGHELWRSLEESGMLSRTALILGNINENAAVRFRVAWAAATLAEYFRDISKKNVIFMVDNMFRFVQAGRELSTLLEEIPSELGYQPTLQTEVAQFENRLISSSDAYITSVQTIYLPADELVNPTVTAALPHLDAAVVLSRDVAQQGRHPAIDPFRSQSSAIDRNIIGDGHYEVVTAAVEILNRYNRLSRIAAIVGEEELSVDDRRVYQRAQKIINFMTQPFFTAEPKTGREGCFVRREQTVRGVQAILNGYLDEVDAEEFVFIGDMESAGLLDSSEDNSHILEDDSSADSKSKDDSKVETDISVKSESGNEKKEEKESTGKVSKEKQPPSSPPRTGTANVGKPAAGAPKPPSKPSS